MRFIILTQYYPPETGAPQNRLSDLAQRLTAMGHRVQVLTALPNYPAGRIFDGYRRRLVQREQLDGVEVLRAWLVASNSRRTLPRLISYLSFVVSAALLGTFRLHRGDFLLVESPPIFLGVSAWWLSRIKRARLIFNVSDLYPETAIALGILQNRWLQKVFYHFEAWCYRAADLVTGQTQGIVASIRRRFPEQAVYLLTNGVDLEQFASHQPYPDRAELDGTLIVGYAGILGHAQKLSTLLETANLLRAEPGVQFHLYGDGPQRAALIAQAKQLDLANVRFMGRCSHTEILEAMCSWGAGVVPLMDTPLMAGALPSKLFEIMAAGLPVILSAPCGEASELIAAAKAGVWAPPEDAPALAEHVRRLAGDAGLRRRLGENGRLFVQEHYDREQIARRLVHFLEQCGWVNATTAPVRAPDR